MDETYNACMCPDVMLAIKGSAGLAPEFNQKNQLHIRMKHVRKGPPLALKFWIKSLEMKIRGSS